VRLPVEVETERMLQGEGGESRVGRSLIAESGADRVMFWARLPILLLSTALGLLIFAWGRAVVGNVAALAALFLYVLDPNVLAHSYLVTMDVAFAACALLFLALLWRYLQQPDVKRLWLCGLGLGVLLAAKYSTLILLPVAGILALAAVRWPTPSTADVPCAFLRPHRPKPDPSNESSDSVGGYAAVLWALVGMCLIATVVLQVFYLTLGGLYLYSNGLQRVNADHSPGYLVFLAGHLQHNFGSYWVWCYLLKEPIATLVLVALGSVAVVRSKSISALGRLFLLLPTLAIFIVHAGWADDLGIRYIIPALPFTFLIGGVGAAWLLRDCAKWGRVLAVILGAWLVAGACGTWPDQISYFNEMACLGGNERQIGLDGGSRCGPLWLDDSNVDWGQGLKQLREWMERHAPGREVNLAYFGTVNPDAYGVAHATIEYSDLMHEPAPGLYAVSSHYVARAPAAGSDWLRRTRPIAVVGHAFYIYDIEPATRPSAPETGVNPLR
jgi:hypothetical protein